MEAEILWREGCGSLVGPAPEVAAKEVWAKAFHRAGFRSAPELLPVGQARGQSLPLLVRNLGVQAGIQSEEVVVALPAGPPLHQFRGQVHLEHLGHAGLSIEDVSRRLDAERWERPASRVARPAVLGGIRQEHLPHDRVLGQMEIKSCSIDNCHMRLCGYDQVVSQNSLAGGLVGHKKGLTADQLTIVEFATS